MINLNIRLFSAYVLNNHLDTFKIYLKKIERTDKTIETYDNMISRFIKWRNKKSREFEPVEYFSFDNCTVAGVECKRTSYNTNLSALKSFGSYMEKKEIINKNPFKILDIKKINQKSTKDYLRLDEVKQLLALDNMVFRDKVIISLLCSRALRLVEISRLRVKDLQTYEGKPCLFIQGKGRTEDQKEPVKIHPRLLNEIEHLISQNICSKQNDFIFQSHSNATRGQILDPRYIWKIVTDAIKRIGVNRPGVTPHSLRHSSAIMLLTSLMQSGVNETIAIAEVQTVLRHKSAQTTSDAYLLEVNKLLRMDSETGEDIIDQLLAS